MSWVLIPHLSWEEYTIPAQRKDLGKRKKNGIWSTFHVHFIKVIISWSKPNYLCLLLLVLSKLLESKVQKNGQGSIFTKNDILLICLPKSQNDLFSLLKNNLQKMSKTLRYLKGIKLDGNGGWGEQIIFTGGWFEWEIWTCKWSCWNLIHVRDPISNLIAQCL